MTQQEFIERYRYDATADLLGEGGFGRVYRAYDNDEHEYVALKIQSVDPKHPELRLRNEVEKVQKYIYRYVARYKDCYTFSTISGEMDVAVMKYYKDGNLEMLLRSGSLGVEDRYDMLHKILEGIAFLHDHGIIHRDLKPQNILIVEHGGKYSPLITDFGISKQLNEGESSAVSNSVLGGTRAYASPEQLKERSIRKNTDLWSFGVIAYQMLTGELPFNSGSYSPTSEEGRQEQFRQMTSGVLPEALNDVPEPWQRLIRECLTVDNEQRLAHAEDCFAILEHHNVIEVAGGETEVVVTDDVVDVETVAEPVKVEEPKVEPAQTPQPQPEPKSEQKPAEPKKKKSKWWLWLLIICGGVFAFMGDNTSVNVDEYIEPGGEFYHFANYVETASDADLCMVWVEGGSVGNYWISATEVTQAQWEAVMGTTIHDMNAISNWRGIYGEGDNYPMYHVNYDDALEFCRRLSDASGVNYTLPTEAQWEYAARCNQSYVYSGSDVINNVAWYDENSGGATYEVATKNPNRFGLYDMTGNVYEWCLDWSDSSESYRVLCGGSWRSNTSICRIANRSSRNPSNRNYINGFRVVCLP